MKQEPNPLSVLPTREDHEMSCEAESPDTRNAWAGGWPQSTEEFEKLVEVFLDRMVVFAFHRLRNIQDAEDVVQEVFVRAFAERFKRRHITKVGPYLYAMVANACTDLRRKRKHAVVSIEEIEAGAIRDGSRNPMEAAAAAEEIRRAEEWLTRLPRKQAEAVRLRVFEELPLSEIAQILGCSVNTVCSRLRYGFRKLREMVAGKRGR